MSKNTSLLNVYIASAGAGKTHTLTREYLLLALRSPRNFAHIQAVTFTNKATAEMKERILKELYILAFNAQASPYIKDFEEILGKTLYEIESIAKKVLWNVLMHYSDFRIKTIDSFFQEVIRSFARELGLSGGYHVELNAQQAVDNAVDELLSAQHSTKANSTVLRWLQSLANQLLAEGKGHNIRKEMGKLGSELLKEQVKRLSQKEMLPSIEELEQFRQEMGQLVQEGKQIGLDGLALMDQYNISFEELNYKESGGLGIFNKLKAGNFKDLPARMLKAIEDGGESLAKKGSPASEKVKDAYDGGIKDLLEKFVEKQSEYLSAQISLSFIYAYGLIGAINTTLRDVNRSQNTLLLTDASSLIAEIIKGSGGIPFIYEKIGSKLHHQMIDEFQDTSSLQYENFLPLLEENLSNGYANLIVGDVKQSIYRWRNSDSSLLSNKVFEDFSNQINKQTLRYNWRSTPEIISFNNALYSNLSEQFCAFFNSISDEKGYQGEEKPGQIFRDYYSDVEQQIPQHSKSLHGQVVIHRWEKETPTNTDTIELEEGSDSDWDDAISVEVSPVLRQIPQVIIDLQERGYVAKDIAILTRRNTEAIAVAEVLLNYPKDQIPQGCTLDIVSEEALIINKAVSVRFIIACLYYITSQQRSSKVELYRLIEAYRALTTKQVMSQEDIDYVGQIGKKSLYEIVEDIFHYFSDLLPSSELAYRIDLLDMVLRFQKDQTIDLTDFLVYWEDTGSKHTIVGSSSMNAISVMTIHKSKGLGFPVVLLPFPNWTIEKSPSISSIIWSKSDKYPFNLVTAIPVPYKKDLTKTYFAKDYMEEKRQLAIDALNLLYVSTTRAETELHLWMENQDSGKTKKGPSTIDDLINLALESGEVPFIEHTPNMPSQMDNAPIYTRKDDKGSSLDTTIQLTEMVSADATKRISILRDGLEYFKENTHLKHGRVMHQILAQIETIDDVDRAIAEAIGKGLITDEQSTEVKTEINRLIAIPEVIRWFDGSGRIYTEATIIGGGLSGSRRPDRIIIYPDKRVEIIDYKFGTPRKAYIQQVQGYMNLLRQMGYTQVSGYLWYILSNEICTIE